MVKMTFSVTSGIIAQLERHLAEEDKKKCSSRSRIIALKFNSNECEIASSDGSVKCFQISMDIIAMLPFR